MITFSAPSEKHAKPRLDNCVTYQGEDMLNIRRKNGYLLIPDYLQAPKMVAFLRRQI